jgi:hypothetical protein
MNHHPTIYLLRRVMRNGILELVNVWQVDVLPDDSAIGTGFAATEIDLADDDRAGVPFEVDFVIEVNGSDVGGFVVGSYFCAGVGVDLSVGLLAEYFVRVRSFVEWNTHPCLLIYGGCCGGRDVRDGGHGLQLSRPLEILILRPAS